LAGARGKFFLVAPISKHFPEKILSDNNLPLPPRRQLFREKNFPHEYGVIALQRLYLNFSYQISLLCPKNQISSPLRGNISSKKMTGAQQKISRGPQNLGARGNLPPPLGGPEGDDARHGQRPLFGNHFVSDIPWRFMLEMMSLSSLLSLV
jgi:hypothetical protein